MILGAGFLVLAGLGLFVGGVLTGITALYWACVGVCAVAAVLLIASRRQTGTPVRASDGDARRTSAATTATTPGAMTPGATTPGATTPGAMTPGATTPGATTPGATGPAVPRPAEDAGAAPATVVHQPGPSAEPPRVAEPATSGEPVTAEQPVVPEPVADEHATGGHPTAHRTPGTGATAAGATRGRGAHAAADEPAGAADTAEPGIEEVEVTDLLVVVDLTDEVLVVDEHPRYHLHGCRFLTGREAIPLPLDEARIDGFTPCARCRPDRHLADRERARRAGRRA